MNGLPAVGIPVGPLPFRKARLPARLLATGAHLPETVVGNEEIARGCGVTPDWIAQHTGFVERRRARADEAASDLGAQAAEEALFRAAVSPGSVDFVVCATCSPDHLFPSTAALIARRIGARGAAAFDLQAGCAGFVYGAVLAAQSVATGTATRALVVGTDVVSRLVDPADPATAPIFGDGAGAALFGPARNGEGFLGTCLGADGDGAHLLHVPAGGSRQPTSEESVRSGGHALHMLGPALFRSAVRHLANAARRAVEASGLTLSDIDLVVPHQSSARLLQATAREIGIPMSRFVVNLDRYGNTSAGSLPIALHEAVASGRAAPGDRVLLLGFGAGLTWGAGLLKL